MWNKPGKPLPPRVYREIPGDMGFRMRKKGSGQRRLPCVLVLALKGATGSRTPGYGERQSCGIPPVEHNLYKQIRRFFKRRPERTRNSFSLQTRLRPKLSVDRVSSRTYPELTTAVLLNRSIPVRLGGPDKHESVRASLGKLNQLPMLMK